MPHPQPYIQITRRSTTFTAHSFKISTDPTDSPTTKKGLNHLNRSSTQGKSATLWPFLFFKLKPWRRYWTFSTVREAFGCCCCRVDSPKYLCLNIKINVSEKLIKALRLPAVRESMKRMTTGTQLYNTLPRTMLYSLSSLRAKWQWLLRTNQHVTTNSQSTQA